MANIAEYCPIIILSVLGAEFVAPFSSRSCSLALKLSLKSHYITTFFVQNDEVFTQMMIFSLKPLF